jgi:hypothetical protein
MKTKKVQTDDELDEKQIRKEIINWKFDDIPDNFSVEFNNDDDD